MIDKITNEKLVYRQYINFWYGFMIDKITNEKFNLTNQYKQDMSLMKIVVQVTNSFLRFHKRTTIEKLR